MGVNMARAHGNVSPRQRPATADSDGGEPLEAAATEPFPSMERNGGGLNSFSLRVDPDAQATVTDFLDFTEYLPSDMARSLTLMGTLDQSYIDASTKVHELTDLWGKLPNVPAASRPEPTKLRAEISHRLDQGMSSRVYAHAEALRMAENVNRHYFRAKTILSKLQTMLEKYPEAEQQQQEQQQQKQQQQQQQQLREKEQQQKISRGAANEPKKTAQPRIHRQPLPRITVPGEVLAPYDLDYESYTGESDVSSPSSDDESPPPPPTTMRRAGGTAGAARNKAVKGSGGATGAAVFTGASLASAATLPAVLSTATTAGTVGGALPATPGAGVPVASMPPLGTTPIMAGTPKTPKARVPRQPRLPGEEPYISTSSALARLKPPPDNAVKGSSDAPWLQLTPYELARLRKRMKKNASWTPSETMIARELKDLGRNLDAFNTARKVAEDEGILFDGSLPKPTVESDGVARVSMGALTVDAAIAAEDNDHSNRGVRLNEAKKQKNKWAQMAAQEAEESTRKMMEAARAMMSYPGGEGSSKAVATPAPTTPAAAATATKKRKREAASDAVADTVEGGAGAQPEKRFKTETPVPIPQPAKSSGSVPPADGLTAGSAASHPHRMRHSVTPVPAAAAGGPGSQQDQNASATMSRQSTSMSSPLSTAGQSTTSGVGPTTATTTTTTTTTVPLKPPAETPVHPPQHKSTTPIHPPVRELRNRDSTRKDQSPQHLQLPAADTEGGDSEQPSGPRRTSRASSRALTPGASSLLPTTEAGTGAAAAPAAPGTAVASTLIAERPRRASTVRNTPVPEPAASAAVGGAVAGATAAEKGRTAGKRVKRPAPGVVSRTSSGGSAAVGQRKAATRKKRGSNAAQQRRSITADGEVPGSSGGSGSGGGGEIEVDDDGNVIDPNEPRYCLCNRVSFGLMIQCDNVENCKQEWFHLECVDLEAVPARTTKWYCPDCRVLLNIGQKGEVSARGVKM